MAIVFYRLWLNNSKTFFYKTFSMIRFNVVHLNTRQLQGIKQQDNPLDFGPEPENLLSKAIFFHRASTCLFQEQPA